MYVDQAKMKAARDRRALTQEALANQARVNVRTVQRAERGQPIHAETLAEIAAVLGVPPAGLLRAAPVKEQEVMQDQEEGQTQVLKRVDSAEIVVSTLERSTMAVLGCTAEPTPETMPSLRQLIQTLERLVRHPWDFDAPPPLSFGSLLDRLEAVVELKAALAEIERNGMALFMATSTAFVKVPYGCEEGHMVTGRTQNASYVVAVRFHIAEYHSERIRISSDVRWPLDAEPEPELGPEWGSKLSDLADNLADDIPF